MTDRADDFMQTAGGGVFWPLAPRACDIRINDIAHALSHLCRYGGHTREFYSVAQHSVLVSRHVAPELALWGLLHDAAEAYVVDVPRPLKRHLAGYAAIEDAVLACVADRFCLTAAIPGEVKVVDEAILADERRCLMRPCVMEWDLPVPGLGIEIEPWPPGFARAAFLERFHFLTRGSYL